MGLSKHKTFLRKEEKAYQEDVELIREVKNGNLSAFREIVEKYEAMVARVVHGMLGNKMDAEDVGQETFIRFYRSIDQFKGDSKLGTYLTRIGINLSLNEIKKRKRQNWLTYEDKLKTSARAVDTAAGIDATEIVNKALSRLDPDFRSVIILRMMQGYSTKETAEILEIPTGTALSRLSRAQVKLKGILQGLGIENYYQ